MSQLMEWLFIAGLQPSVKFVGTHLYIWMERGTESKKHRSRTQTARSGDKHIDHEVTTPPSADQNKCELNMTLLISLCVIKNIQFVFFFGK